MNYSLKSFTGKVNNVMNNLTNSDSIDIEKLYNKKKVNIFDLKDKIKLELPQDKLNFFKKKLDRINILKDSKEQIFQKKEKLNKDFNDIKRKFEELSKKEEKINKEEKELIQFKEELKKICRELSNQ